MHKRGLTADTRGLNRTTMQQERLCHNAVRAGTLDLTHKGAFVPIERLRTRVYSSATPVFAKALD